MRSQTSVVIWWSSWMTVPVCLTVFTTAMSTPVMLWMATGSSMSTPTTEADSTSWERGSTGGTGTGVPPVPSWVPLGESLNFSHQTKLCCNYIILLFIKDVEFLKFLHAFSIICRKLNSETSGRVIAWRKGAFFQHLNCAVFRSCACLVTFVYFTYLKLYRIHFSHYHSSTTVIYKLHIYLS